METITPAKIEARLYELSKEIDESHKSLVDAETDYHSAKTAFEIAMAKSRIRNSHPDLRMTVGMREDQALIENEDLAMAVSAAEIRVKAERANAQRIRTQVDIARSIGTSVRSSMEIV